MDEDTFRISNSQTDDLSSERGVDYTNLRNLLASGQWREADQETLAVMLKAANREEDRWLRVEDIEEFPCTDLRTINSIWVKYSKGRFGFSVQKRIWESVGGTPNADYETYCHFGDRVKWRVDNKWMWYEDLTFTTEAPAGHLPVWAWTYPGLVMGMWDGMGWAASGRRRGFDGAGGVVSSVASRLVNCNIIKVSAV